MAPTTCPAISKTKSNAWGSKHHPPSCESPRLGPVEACTGLRQHLPAAAIVDRILGRHGAPKPHAMFAELARRLRIGPARTDQMITILWHCDLLEDLAVPPKEIVVILRSNSRSCRTASIRSGIVGGLAGELSGAEAGIGQVST
jgi:hypothetical protein